MPTRWRTLCRRGPFVLAFVAALWPTAAEASDVAFDQLGELLDRSRRRACERIGSKLGSVSIDDCLTAGLQPTSGHSVDGVPILVREVTPRRPPIGRVLLFGGIHGDEYSSVSIVFKWLEMIERSPSNAIRWRIFPLLNPDGLLRSRSRRMNANGVDLNRNFPCPDWRTATHDYWVRRTSRNPRRYPGTGPLSEPESRFLASQIAHFRPDIIVAVHAPHSVVDYDGPPEAPERLGSLQLKLLGTYPGSLGRWAGVHLNLPVVTIELPSAGIMPAAADQRQMWSDLLDWLDRRLDVAQPAAIAGR